MTGQLTFYLKHSLNDLRANRQRTVFALLCIAAGVAAIVGLQTLGELINDTLTGSLREANKGDIHIFSGPESDTPEAVQRQGRAEGVLEPGGQFFPDYFGQAGLDRIQAWFDTHYPGAAAITYQQTFSDLTTGTGISLPARQTEKTFVSSYIVDAARFPLYGERVSLDGVPLRDLIQHPDDIVISDNLADDLGAEIGDTLRLSGASADFTLRGVVSADAEAGVDNLFAGLFGFYYLDLDAAQYFSQEPATYDLYVRLNDDSQLAEIEAAFRAEFPYITVITTQDLKDRNAQISRIINGLVTVMGLVALLIGGIGIANTMLVIVNRRAAEVAILKTVGLEPREVTLLFLTEAILMGIIGSVAGVLSGWLIAFVARGLAESFVAQSLEFRFAPGPALTGLVIGILITAIFGFLPTLAAGRVRPVTVMRPSDAVVPKAGRRLTAVAILALLLALSVLTQGLVGDLIGLGAYRAMSGILGAISGGLVGLSAPQMRETRRAIMGTGSAAVGFLAGYLVPALLVLAGAFILLVLLYGALWVLIWAVGSGSRVFQRFLFVDLRLALRAMVATKGRSASSLLALVVGVFTLSLITMLVDSITQQFESMLEREAGGNVLVLSTGRGPIFEQVESVLTDLEDVHSYAVVGSYNVRLRSVEDGATGTIESYEDLQSKIAGQDDLFRRAFEGLDARELDSNLPDVDFYQGRQLGPEDAGQPVVVIEANEAVIAAGLNVGDWLTFDLVGAGGISPDQDFPTLTLEVVGMVDRRYGSLQISGSANYAPAGIFSPGQAPDQVTAVVDIDTAQIPALREAAAGIPGTFVLETRFLNEVVNRLVDQFTAFPILVAGLALFTGGIVIGNSVALSAMERRREIAIMKAIGLQRERVVGMLLLENALMGLIGGLIGVGIGVLLLAALLVGFFGGDLGHAIPYGTAFLLMGLCVLIALVAALLPVWGTSGEKPLNVLRYE